MELIMLSILKKYSLNNLNKKLSIKLEQATHAYKNGEIKIYRQLSHEEKVINKELVEREIQIVEIDKQIVELDKKIVALTIQSHLPAR
tara:strand:- start:14045 stop:14308 length:264 start_codon:yes stop_codon:yes gene_type:complete